jgi:hypothetical protein
MSDELKFPGQGSRDSLGEPLARIVREAYEPRTNEGEMYWTGLESRIMARVRAAGTSDRRWWSVLAPWAQAGLIAATAVFALTSVINQQMSDTDSQYAYESVVQPATPDVDASEALLGAPDKATGTDATLDYVLSH